MKLTYRIVNVFAKLGEPFSGNPLCVVEDGDVLDFGTMQAIALQFNLSETVFILSSEQADARIRIFTPARELPFAGHPTLGSAHVVRATKGTGDRIRLQTHAGIISVTASADRWTLIANSPSKRVFDESRRPELAEALGIGERVFAGSPLWVDAGMEHLLVPLNSKDAVNMIVPRPGLEKFGNSSGQVSIYCFSPVAEETILTRLFFGKNVGSISEDPATGSACANLGGYLLAIGFQPPFSRELLQGEKVGRPSYLRLCVSENGSIGVTGEVIEIGRGELRV